MTKITNLPPRLFIKAAAMCWFISLCLPAMTYDDCTYYGYEAMVMGILFGWVDLIFQPYSNITFWIALIMTWLGKKPVNMAALTFIVGLSSFLIFSILNTGDKGTHDAPIESWGWGALLWIIAYALLLLGSAQATYPTLLYRLRYWIPFTAIGFCLLFVAVLHK